MPKENVTEVTLVANQELPPAVAPNETWIGNFGPPESLFSYGMTIAEIGNIISAMIGTAVNRPDRVYEIGSVLPPGAEIQNDEDDQPTIMFDPYLNGLDYSVHLRGIEYLIKGSEWQNDVSGGGYRYTDGRIFEEGQVITVSFKPQISSIISTPDAIARFVDASGIQLVQNSTTLLPSAQRKLVVVVGVTTSITVTLDSTYPEGVLCRIITGSGAQKQTAIAAPVGQDMFQNGIKSRFVLGQADCADFIRLGSRWYVCPLSDRWARVGHVVFGGIPGANAISANGQVLAIADYPGVDDYLTALEIALPGSVVPQGQWATNKTKWARGATSIIVPQYGGWFPRFLDLGAGKDIERPVADRSRVGSTQASTNKQHNHGAGEYNKLLRINGQFTVANTNNTPGEPNLSGAADMIDEGSPVEARPENIGLPAIIYI